MNQLARHLVSLLLPFAISQAHASAETFEESLSMANGAKYVVVLKQETPAGLNDKHFGQFGHWGAEGAKSSFCISSMVVTRRSLAVRVPGKVYADLCNVRSIRLSERNGLFVMSLSGGDAGDSFSAEFLFRGVYLVERMVRHGEFPDAFERTQFRYNTYEN